MWRNKAYSDIYFITCLSDADPYARTNLALQIENIQVKLNLKCDHYCEKRCIDENTRLNQCAAICLSPQR